jgi:hypothetical protein
MEANRLEILSVIQRYEKAIALHVIDQIDRSAQAKMLEPPYKLEGQHKAAAERMKKEITDETTT